MSHLVHQHRFHIECQQLELGKAIQQELPTILETDLYPKLQILLDTYDQEHAILEIEKLQIQLPTLSVKNWQFHLVQESLLAIEEQLKKIVRFDNGETAIRSTHLVVHHTPMKAQELFFFFLKNGYLSNNSISNHLPIIWAQLAIDEIFVENLLDLFLQEPAAFVRFLLLQDKEWKQEVFRLFGQKKPPYLFDHFFSSSDVALLNEANFLTTEMQSRGPLPPTFLQTLFQLLYPLNQVIADFIHKKELFLELKNMSLDVQNIHSKNDLDFIIQLVAFVEKTIHDDDLLVEKRVERQQASAVDFYYINNAGLVIIHPFLPKLFTNCGFTDTKNEWVSKKAQHEAATLLQYLFHGKEIIFESELLLNKVLCGFDIKEVVDTHFELKDSDKQHCLDLLHTVIDYWEVLKNTSVEALRETFLSREGKLCVEEEYRLIVEQKGVDVLLDRLPWGIGTITTPWMNTVLHCQWNS